jgi:diguanylate cyclase (GGDEF)-like protein
VAQTVDEHRMSLGFDLRRPRLRDAKSVRPASAGHRHRLGLARRFWLVLAVLVLVLGGVGWAGLAGLSSANRSLSRIHQINVTDQDVVRMLAGRVDDAQLLILRGRVTANPRSRDQLASRLSTSVLPEIRLGMSNVRLLTADNPSQSKLATKIGAQWSAFEAMWEEGQWGSGRYRHQSAHVVAITASLRQLNALADELYALQNAVGTRYYRQARANEASSQQTMLLVMVLGVITSIVTVLWLTRAVLPRMLKFAAFAGLIAKGDYVARLAPKGDDEIDRLGLVLDEVAERRQQAEEYERTQTEFSDALQLTEDEHETQDLLRRHLERSIPACAVTVFNKNNSADRLEAVSSLPQDSPLSAALEGAHPRDCIAVRAATPHAETPADKPLVACKLCADCGRKTSCTPLLVSGEVIGSILVQHDRPLGRDDARRIRESVAQAAPAIANLRNLAIAQTRAGTDVLTGLPNRRALEDMIKRMVAGAHRSNAPLAALMLDIDHFKRTNDVFGHSKGDEILAAIGASLPHWLRQSDFIARYGGEEFLVLLPNTDVPAALIIAEKIRSAIPKIELAGDHVPLTISVGVAALPDHALDAEQLERAADRALYAAKNNGSNRVEVASGPAAVHTENAAA